MEVMHEGLLIGGEMGPASKDERFSDMNPSTGQTLATVASATAEDVERAIGAARKAQSGWYAMESRVRAQLLVGVGALIRRDADELARLEALDTGKPLRQAATDVEVAARYFEFYGGITDKVYGDTIPLAGDSLALTLREPMGVTAHIIPWNYPIAIGARTVAPAIAAGNACVVKPAEEAPLSMVTLGRLMLEAGIPPGVVNVLPGLGEVAGAALAGSPHIDHLSFTGGLDTGSAVMAAAARNVVPVMLELGGKSPSIVYEDADLDRAMPVIVNALIQNAGQTCSACTRAIVHRSRADEFIERFSEKLEGVRLGIALEDSDMGPLISAAQKERVEGYIDLAATEGCEVFSPECAVPTSGYFLRPSMLTVAEPSMRVAQEEIFGPVIAVLEADDDHEATEMADASPYGLIAAVWTQDIDHAMRAARKLRCGQVYINSYGAGGGVELPFGGFKRSGFGREKGVEALREYTQTKTIVVDVR